MKSKDTKKITIEQHAQSFVPNNLCNQTHQLQIESQKEIKNQKLDRNSYVIDEKARRLNRSGFYPMEHRRTVTPSLHPPSADSQSYIEGLQRAMLQENRNIRQHNAFLKGQIKLMFEREKKHKRSLQASRLKIKQLEGVNRHLQYQLSTIYSSIISEIERIQKIIQEQNKNRYDQLLMISQSFNDIPQKSMDLGSETESTINNNLEELKQKMAKMTIHKTSFDSFSQEDCLKFQSPIQKRDNDLSSHKIESIVTKENSLKDPISLQIEKDELFEAYLPSHLIADTKTTDKHCRARKN